MLKTFRQQHKLTQGKMAEYIGVPRTTYQSWEKGRRNPSPQNQLHINAFIRRVKAHEMANEYYNALTRYETKPRFSLKRKLLKLLVAFIITLIIVVLW